MNKWKNVKDELPPMFVVCAEQSNSSDVLVSCSDGFIKIAYATQNIGDELSWISSCSEGWLLNNVTHWQELPKAPYEI